MVRLHAAEKSFFHFHLAHTIYLTDRAAHGPLRCNLLKQGHDLDRDLISDCDTLAQRVFEMQ